MPPVLGLIAGSRAYDLLTSGAFGTTDPEPVATPYGPSSPLWCGALWGHEVVLISRHGRRGYEIAAPFVNYRANLYALKDHGASRVLAWSGPGAINPGLAVGQYAIPRDVLDETRGREGTFFTGGGLGFIRQWPVFCPQLADFALTAAAETGRAVQDDTVYVCTQGPRLETPAEIRKFATQGADLVGMTLAPEVFLAKELEMCYAAICYVANYAEGVVRREFRPGELFEGMLSAEERQAADEAVRALPDLFRRVLELAASQPIACRCGQTMERYKRRGDIGDDWREWVRVP